MTQRRQTNMGFTLMELSITIGVILILMVLVLSASRRAFTGQDERATKNLLITLDRALSEYMSAGSNTPPKYDAEMYENVPGPDFAVGDSANNMGGAAFATYPSGGSRHPKRPDAAVFIRQTRGYGEVDAIINGIDSRFLQTTISGSGTNVNDPAADPTPSVVDMAAIDDAAWKEKDYASLAQTIVLYVHPGNPLAQDLYGKCLNGRPYFVAAGLDGKIGIRAEFAEVTADAGEQLALAEKALADNIYSYKPGPFKKGMNER